MRPRRSSIRQQVGTRACSTGMRAAPFCVSEPINDEPASPGNGATIGFKCDSPEQVQHFHDIAVAAGGISIEKPPGLRESSMGPTWLAYVRDPDGNKLCAIYRPA